MLAQPRLAHTGQSDSPKLLTIRAGDRVRSVYAGRVGTATKVYPDGSAAVCWDDGEPQPEGLAHERMPRALLEVVGPVAEDRAQPEPSALQIVADALRAAAFAPTPSAALDIAGAALANIADLARGEPPRVAKDLIPNCTLCESPAARDTRERDSFLLVREIADETLRVFDRVASVLEAIERLSIESDDAIADLAALARGLVAKQTDRVDHIFTCTTRYATSTGEQS
jgi:hypothetical protein